MGYPSFEKQHGRKPIAGLDYDPEAPLCQDDYERLTGTGRYQDCPACQRLGLCRACENGLSAEADYYEEQARNGD